MPRSIAFVAVLLIASGCGGATHPTPAAGPRHGAPHAVATVEAAPTLPQLASVNSLAGGAAFAGYFIELQNYAMRTGHTEELRGAIAPECFLCLAVPTLVESTYRSGGRIDGGQWVPTTRIFTEADYPGGRIPKGYGFFDVSIHLQPMTVLSGHGRVLGTYAGSNHDRYLSLSTSWRNGRWLVDHLSGAAGQQL